MKKKLLLSLFFFYIFVIFVYCGIHYTLLLTSVASKYPWTSYFTLHYNVLYNDVKYWYKSIIISNIMILIDCCKDIQVIYICYIRHCLQHTYYYYLLWKIIPTPGFITCVSEYFTQSEDFEDYTNNSDVGTEPTSYCTASPLNHCTTQAVKSVYQALLIHFPSTS